MANIYQLKITLTGTKPPIWRRILVPSNLTLSSLHNRPLGSYLAC